MKLAEIKELAKEDIADQLKKSRHELVDLRMKFVSRQLEDVSQIKKKRKEIARLLTVQAQKLVEPESKQAEKKSEKQIKVTKKTVKPKLPKKQTKKVSGE